MNCNTKITIGMDLGDKNHMVTILDADGNVTAQECVANNASVIRSFFSFFQHPSVIRVAMECGTHSPWLSREIAQMGFEVLVGNARKLRAIWQTDHKDDTRDSEMIARIARFDPELLYPICHRNQTAQADLAILRVRDEFVRSRTGMINSVRGLVKSYGGRLPKCSAHAFANAVGEQVPDDLLPAVAPMLEEIHSITVQIKRFDQKLEDIANSRYAEETKRVRQIQGVGALTSLAFVLTLEAPTRFDKNRQAGPYLGLTPKIDQSGETNKELSISHAGDAFLRRLLTQSAHYILGPFGPDCDLRRAGERIQKSGGKHARGKAVTAVTRKLAVLMLRLWRTGEVYDPFHKAHRSEKTTIPRSKRRRKQPAESHPQWKVQPHATSPSSPPPVGG